MNTGSATIDYEQIQQCLDAISNAQDWQGISASLESFCSGAGVSHYLALNANGTDQAQGVLLHNLHRAPAEPGIADHPLTRTALAGPIPQEFIGGLDVPELKRGVVAGAAHGASACVIFVGHPSDHEFPDLLGLLGICSMAAAHLVDASKRLGSRACPLTRRELEVLTYFATGATAKETARWLDISHRTVEEYIDRCRKRLAVDSTLAATALALRNGWMNHRDIDRLAASLSCRYEAARTR